jgi:hypothetical protein
MQFSVITNRQRLLHSNKLELITTYNKYSSRDIMFSEKKRHMKVIFPFMGSKRIGKVNL